MNETAKPNNDFWATCLKILKIATRVFSIIVTVLLVLIIVFNLTNLILRKTSGELQPRIFGYSTAVIISGSMEPAINVNDLVIYKEKDTYEIGDMVIFANQSGRSCTTHRIVDVAEDGFITQGDANNTPDGDHITNEEIFGAVVLIIPGVGYISQFLGSPLGMLVMVFVGFGIILLPQLFDMGKKKKDDAEQE